MTNEKVKLTNEEFVAMYEIIEPDTPQPDLDKLKEEKTQEEEFLSEEEKVYDEQFIKDYPIPEEEYD